MPKPIPPEELWEMVRPLLPPERAKAKGGRPRVPERACLTGILYVRRTGIPWEYLPREMAAGAGGWAGLLTGRTLCQSENPDGRRQVQSSQAGLIVQRLTAEA
jgi:hypothetical protein